MKTKTCSLLLLATVALSFPPILAWAFGNDDITKLKSSGFSDEMIGQAISSANPATFDTSADGLIALKKAGVSDALIQKVMARQSAAAPPLAADNKKETFLTDGRILSIEDGRATDLSTENLSQRPAFFSLVPKVYIDFRPIKSAKRIRSSSPEFEQSLEAQFAPQNKTFLLRLSMEGDKRVSTVLTNGGTGFQKADVIPLAFEQVQDGNRADSTRKTWRYKPQQPLAPGEYAVFYEDRYYTFGIDAGADTKN